MTIILRFLAFAFLGPMITVWQCGRYAGLQEGWFARIAVFVTMIPVMIMGFLFWVCCWGFVILVASGIMRLF